MTPAAHCQHKKTLRDNALLRKRSASPIRPSLETPATPFTVSKRRTITNDSKKAHKRRDAYRERRLVQAATLDPGDQSIMVQALQTASGRRAFPVLAAHTDSPGHEDTILQDNVSQLLASAGRQHRARLAHSICSNLTSEFCTTLGLPARFVEYAARQSHKAKKKQDYSVSQYPTGTSRSTFTDEESAVLEQMYARNTIVYSGSKSSLRTLPFTDWQFEARIYAEYPTYLRLYAEVHPHVMAPSFGLKKRGEKKGWTVFKANILGAVAQAQAPDFDSDKAREARHAAAVTDYYTILGRKNGTLPRQSTEEQEAAQKEREERCAAFKDMNTFVEQSHHVLPPDFRVFKKFLKDQGHRYTIKEKAHPCDICESGPILEISVPALTRRAAVFTTDNKEVPQELRKLIRQQTKRLDFYALHKAQFAVGRRNVTEREASLLVGEALIFRDYVNHHDLTGWKINCLHWVIRWRSYPGGPLNLLKIRHYCSDKMSQSCSAHYTVDVEQFHFKPYGPNNPGLFEELKITKVIFAGDHGPHFACFDTLYHEASCKKLYNIEVELLWLTSYHAYNRCDGAGAEDSTSHNTDTRGGLPREGALSWTNMTNESSDAKSWAYHFECVSQNETTFPSNLNKIKHIKKWSEVKFLDHYRGPGLLKYRLVSGVGDWTYGDLHPAAREGGDWLCDTCSTRNCAQVFHTRASLCPSPGDVHILPVHFISMVPDPARIQGEQIRRGAAARKSSKGPTYPCKFGCVTEGGRAQSSRSATAANKHMQIKHSGEEHYETSKYLVPLEESEALTSSHVLSTSSSRVSQKDKTQSETSSTPPLSLLSGPRSVLSSPLLGTSSSNVSETSLPPTVSSLPPTSLSTSSSGVRSKDKTKTGQRARSNEKYGSESDSSVETSESSQATAESTESDEEGDEKEFEAEAILAHSGGKRPGHKMYRVKWKGYTKTTWEPATSLRNCHKLLADYEKHPNFVKNPKY
jgi:hypothetical protein